MQTLLMDLRELWRVTVAALVFGAGLPAIFALGVRFQSRSGIGSAGGGAVSVARRRAAAAAAMICYAAVAATVVAGVLFVAKAFLAARLGIHLFGAG
ncbi:hypothetical protein IU500_05180 [Nocardia terpenica]|uniref:hypothetical protein n=1 Tax=Nocardia terpenica TaxID=455432 RepID=UPI0018952E26|nr:hypothetical protein [Nocardia terpenica]MBF6060176.1 hypothetical protein [Nocardia terpenica]MBF6103436.1 hypothetical protein [Nocardia terpenica]MBF6112190.1 hypothetical protein [Nocardia terpenica]MBF6117657.1 hypothetical protein [Nocardia terpenica]MBF6153599.1 hypothetical protein [Nocardia terpenica]